MKTMATFATTRTELGPDRVMQSLVRTKNESEYGTPVDTVSDSITAILPISRTNIFYKNGGRLVVTCQRPMVTLIRSLTVFSIVLQDLAPKVPFRPTLYSSRRFLMAWSFSTTSSHSPAWISENKHVISKTWLELYLLGNHIHLWSCELRWYVEWNDCRPWDTR